MENIPEEYYKEQVETYLVGKFKDKFMLVLGCILWVIGAVCLLSGFAVGMLVFK